MRIGIFGTGYPSRRMIIDKVPECEYVQLEQKNVVRLYVIGLKIIGKMFPKFQLSERYARHVFFLLDEKSEDVNIIHSFNRVCVNEHSKWVTTFEKTLPEYFYDERNINLRIMTKQKRYLLSEQCIGIFPLSKWSYEYEIEFLKNFTNKKEFNTIVSKMQVLYPPQELLIRNYELESKFTDTEILRFLYIGKQFRRKGGLNVLHTLAKLREKYSFSLTLIGDYNDGFGAYALHRNDVKEIESLLDKNKDWIEYYKSLPNNEVIKKMKTTHVGLLPTIGDTFGFSVLEMQACGCPVVTTNREALPEINDNERGWIIDTNKVELTNRDDYANYTISEVQKLSKVIDEQLINILELILGEKNRGRVLRCKAECCIKSILENHSPQQYADKLRKIYKSSLDK